jgi:hypothetical protein
MAPSMNVGRTVVACAWFFIAMTAAAAQGNPLPRLVVKCVDAEGKPVSDVEVHLLQHRKGITGASSYEHSGPHQTGADGFATTAIAIDYDGGCFDRWFYARVPGKSVGAMRCLRLDTTAPPEPAEPVIRLEPSREVRGVVRVPEGLRAQSVRVRTLTVIALAAKGGTAGAYPRVYGIDGLRDALPTVFDATVAEDGRFALRDLPAHALVYLAAEGPGLGQAQWSNVRLPERKVPDSIELSMEREAVLGGTVIGPGGKPVADAVVNLRIERSMRQANVQCAFETRSDAAGRFRLVGLPAGTFQLVVLHGDGVVRPLPVELADAQELVQPDVILEDGVDVRGIVRGVPGNVAMERVGMTAITDDDRHWRLGFAQTDPQGRFVLRLPKGPAMLYVSRVPRGFQQPPSSYDQLLRLDVQPGDKALTELVFEIEKTK